MITLSELFSNMAHGELSNISIGDPTLGVISPADYAKLVSHVQLGLTALHQRFLIRRGSLTLQQHSGLVKYWLKSAFSSSNTTSTETIKYILDAVEPYEDDLLKVEQVLDATGVPYRINDSTEAFVITTPKFNCLQFLTFDLVVGDLWTVEYRSNHPKILLTDTFNPSEVELDIPTWAEEPLQAYTAARIMLGQAHSIFEGVSEGDKYMTRYEQLCQTIELQNLDTDDNETYDRFTANGWV